MIRAEHESNILLHLADCMNPPSSCSILVLQLGFHPLKQVTFFEIVDAYADAFNLDIDKKNLRAEALEWSMTRGSRSGRVAWQFVQDLAGRLGKKIN